jgi:hypothetical protein
VPRGFLCAQAGATSRIVASIINIPIIALFISSSSIPKLEMLPELPCHARHPRIDAA